MLASLWRSECQQELPPMHEHGVTLGCTSAGAAYTEWVDREAVARVEARCSCRRQRCAELLDGKLLRVTREAVHRQQALGVTAAGRQPCT